MELKIKQFRKEKGFTADKLSEKLHIGQSTLSQYENGKRDIGTDTLCKLADILNVSVDELLGRNPQKTIIEYETNIFPSQLRKLRRDKQLTQDELGKALNVSNGTIAMWETNKRQPDIETIIRIAKYFNVSLDYLLSTKSPPVGPSTENNETKFSDSKKQKINIYRTLRKNKGLTQVELSDILHVTQATVSKWEKDKTVPDQATLVQLSKFYNVSIDSLLKNTDSISCFPTPSEESTLSDNKKQLIDMIKDLSEDDTMIALGVIARLNNQPVSDIIKKIN